MRSPTADTNYTEFKEMFDVDVRSASPQNILPEIEVVRRNTSERAWRSAEHLTITTSPPGPSRLGSVDETA